jgi:hypothetical protein
VSDTHVVRYARPAGPVRARQDSGACTAAQRQCFRTRVRARARNSVAPRGHAAKTHGPRLTVPTGARADAGRHSPSG